MEGYADGQHPSSVNFRLPKSEFGSTQLVYFTLMQSKKLYAWEVGPVDDRGLVALCGDLADFKVSFAVGTRRNILKPPDCRRITDTRPTIAIQS